MSAPTARELLDAIRLPYELSARVERVLALHKPTPSFGSMDFCWCGDVWPCPTVRLLDGEEL